MGRRPKQTLSKDEVESESHSVISNSLWPHRLYSPWNSPGQNIGVGSLSLLQGIFPTQGSNPGLSHRRWILYHLSHQGSPCAYCMPAYCCCMEPAQKQAEQSWEKALEHCVGPFHETMADQLFPQLSVIWAKIFLVCLNHLGLDFLPLVTQNSRACIPCLTNVILQYNALSTGLSFLLDFKFCEERAWVIFSFASAAPSAVLENIRG